MRSYRAPRVAVIMMAAAIPLFAAAVSLDRWAAAVGGRAALSSIRVIYREATIQVAGLTGSIKAWHTADGQYRKEEKVGPYATVEVFDGTSAVFRRGTEPPVKMEGADLQRARSTAFANANVLFYVFFPDRRRGELEIEPDGAIVLKPTGGIDWRVILDSETALPKTMIHQEGDKTITVTFVSYETVGGITLEHEIHRTTGDPRFTSDIRFTKTVLNPPVEPTLFSVDALTAARDGARH